MYENSDFSSNYEELKTYYPRFYYDVLEMMALLKTYGDLADDLDSDIKQVLADCFIDTADEQTIRRLEEFLYIPLQQNRTLNDRRRLVKSFFIGNGKLSATMLSDMVNAYTGAGVHCTFEPFDLAQNNMLHIFAERGAEQMLYIHSILLLVKAKLPAHIAHDLSITYKHDTVITHRITFGADQAYYCGQRFSGQEGAL